MSLEFTDLPRTMTRGAYRALSHMFRKLLWDNRAAYAELKEDYRLFGCCFHRIVQGRLVRIDPVDVAYGPDGVPVIAKGGEPWTGVTEGLP